MADEKDMNGGKTPESTSKKILSDDLQIEDIDLQTKAFQSANISQKATPQGDSVSTDQQSDDLDKLISEIDSLIEQN